MAGIVAATPPWIWLDEYPPLVDASVPVPSLTHGIADWLAAYLADSALLRGREDDCFLAKTASLASSTECLADVDAALRASPANGELWLFKASILSNRGEYGAPMLDALRNSYLSAPVEGWIASGRVVFGLQLYPILPDALKAMVSADLRLVLMSPKLFLPLGKAYAGDPLLRSRAAEPINALPADQIARFVDFERKALQDAQR